MNATRARLCSLVLALACAPLASAVGRPEPPGRGEPPGQAKKVERSRDTLLSGDAVRIHVAPGGATDGPALGSPAHPAGSVAAAQTLVRAAIARMGGARKSIEVLFAPGEYRLESTLALTAEDSGAPGAPVVWRAQTPGTAVLSGGTRLTGAPGADGVLHLHAVDLDPGQWTGGGQLYVNAQRATLAREPDHGDYWFIKAGLPQPGETEKDRGTQAFQPWGEAQPWIATLSAADKSRAVLNVMQVWTSGLHRFDGAQPPDGIRVKPKSIWPYRSRGLNQRFYIENVMKAFDAPGEWFGDGAEVLYRPRSGEPSGKIDAVLARLDKLLTISGDPATGKIVQNVEFRGLSFQHQRYAVPADGYQDNQAASRMGAAIEIDGAKGVIFDQCIVAHTGGYGMWLRQSVRETKITRSTLRDLGAGGVRIGLVRQPEGDTMPTGANLLTDSVIVGTGRVMPGAVGVWVGQSFDNEVSHNAISDTTYTGISVGWTWGYGGPTSGGNRIVANLLYDIGRGALADGAGIYTLGIAPGTEIVGNVIREVRGYDGYGFGMFGLYNDQGSSKLMMKNNIVVGTDNGGYVLHFGRDLTLTQNVFALGESAELRITKPEDDTNLTIADNLLIPRTREPLEGKFPPAGVKLRGNRVSDRATGGKPNVSSCNSGCEPSQVTVMTGPAAKDLRFQGLDGATQAWVTRVLAEAGPSGELPRLREVPQIMTLTSGPQRPFAPPVPVELDLADARPGSQPQGLRYVPANDPKAIGVVDDGRAPGGHCLQFADSPRFAAKSEPNAYAFLNHERGTSTARFAIRYDAAAAFLHEWRNNSRPYGVGPSLRFDAAGITAAGRVVARPNPGEWIDVTITAPVDRDDGRWTLELRGGGRELGRWTDLPFGTPGWQRLNWIGFVSNAATDSTACLASLAVTNNGVQPRSRQTR